MKLKHTCLPQTEIICFVLSSMVHLEFKSFKTSTYVQTDHLEVTCFKHTVTLLIIFRSTTGILRINIFNKWVIFTFLYYICFIMKNYYFLNFKKLPLLPETDIKLFPVSAILLQCDQKKLRHFLIGPSFKIITNQHIKSFLFNKKH